MKKIGFIGAYDKMNFLIYVAKILSMLNSRVLIIDTTVAQKAKYIVPTINDERRYITNYMGIDISVGFFEMEDIQMYLGCSDLEHLPYDYIFIDTDDIAAIESFKLNQTTRNYFATGFDNYSLRKGLEVLNKIESELPVTTITFAEYASKEEDEYLKFLAKDMQIKWTENQILVPIENGDGTVIAENQRLNKIKLKKISTQYKDAIFNMVKELDERTSDMRIRSAIKNSDKGA